MTRNRIVALLGLSATLIASPRPAGAAFAPRLGVEGGLNLSELTYHADAPLATPAVGFRPAWWAGATAEMPFTERWSIVTGARYVEYGEVEDWTVSTLRIRQHRTLQYVAFPFGARWRPFTDRPLSLTLGPEVGYLVGARWDVALPAAASPRPAPEPARPDAVTAQIFEDPFRHPTDFFYPWNAVATLGALYELPLEHGAVLVHLRYTEGLTDVARGSLLRRTVRAFELGAGWRW